MWEVINPALCSHKDTCYYACLPAICVHDTDSDSAGARLFHSLRAQPLGKGIWGYASTETVSHHDANFVITGGTGGCQNDNLQCHQWWQSWNHGYAQFSMTVYQ